MKTRLLFLTILFSFLLTSVVWAQCPPGNIIFTTQAQVDAFAVDFPNCTEIGGSLDISGSDITDLSPLQNLTQIGGSLTIDHNDQLKSLDGLENIQNVGFHLFIYKNNQLISLDALQNLSMISGYVEIRENANLSSLSGLENLQKVSDNLTIYKNNQLVSLESLQNLTMIGGYLIISENASLTSISGLDNLQTISDNLTIHNNDLLGSIEGLQNLTQIGGYLYIEHNDQLTSLDGLENLQNVGVDLFIHSNNLLVSLEGLQNLTQVGGYLYIGNNPSLPSLNGLQNLVAINGDLKIPNNAQLLTLQGLQNLNPTTISFLELANNPNLSYCSLENICTYLSDPDNPRTISGNSGDCADIAAVQNDCNGGNNTGPGTGFITTWKTNNSGSSGNNQITIPTEGTGYNYNIYWEEVGNSDNSGSATGITGDHTITFSSEGTYQVEITGDFPRIFFNREGDKDKILTIDQWGNIAWSSMESAFAGCTHVQGNATDAPDLSNVTSTARMFLLATEFNQDLNNWNVSNITDMNYMFNFAGSFNGNISSWDVSKVKNFEAMFRHAKFFNQDISGWETESAEDMQDMFSTAQAFNQDISGWDVSSVHYMVGMFSYTNAFNQDISNWDVSNVEYMNEIFREASAFNQNIGEWDVSKVKAMVHLLANTALSTANYDATLIGWAAQDVQPNVTLGAEGLTYCAAVSARQSLIDKHGWNISSDMIVSEDCGMVVYVRIKNDSTISIPSYGSDSFQQLKQKIKDRTGIDTKDQTLYFNNMVMGDGRTLEEFNVQHGSIIYLNPNQNPTVANPIPDQSAAQDILFTFQFAANTFADLDEDDVLTYTAQLAGGGNLPSWLSFTTSTRTFTGTPGNNDVGAIHIEVMANDGKGGTVSDTFTLTVGSRPTVTITTLAPFPTNEPFSVDIEFSEAVTGFIAVDVEVTNGMASDLATTDNVTYQILVTPTADGPVSVQVPENVAQNINSVSNAASNEIIGTYDQTDPLVVTRDITVFLDTNGGVSIDVDAVDNGSSDAGGIATRILSESEFDCSDLGYNFIELKVTDDAGNMGSAMATVTVVDTLDPVPSNQSLTDFTGECQVNLYDLTPPTANDNCSGSITGTTDATFPITTIGTTTITWTYEDDEGNSVTQNQDIIVEPCPKIAVSVEQLTGITAECSTLFSDLTLPPTVEVTFDNSTNQSVSVTWQAGNYNPSTGIHTISGTLNLTEIENPDNLMATLTITVRDTEDPVPSSQSLTDFTGECQVNLYDLTPPTADDNCSGSITGTTDATFPITTQGTTTITWTFEDDAGNVVTQTQKIVIKDATAPVPDVDQLEVITVECSAGISVFPTATDHCAGQITATTDDPLQYNQKGNYTITWMYDDGHGNTSTQLQTVTVTNSSEPVMICPQRRIVSCDPIVTFELPEAMNDCGSVAVIQTDDTGLSSGSVFPVGITTLRYKTSDPNSSVTCLIEIEVLPDLVVKHRSGIGFGDTLHIPVCLPPSISKENLDLGPHQDRASVRSSIYKGNLPANPEFGLWKLSLYTYQVEDQCGNSEYFENYVALYDIAPPIFLSFPNDTTVDTPADLPPVPTHSRNVRIIDICRYVAWDTVITEPIPDPVNQDTLAFVRRWIAEDEVGNKSFRDQMIYVRSTSPADFNTITAHIVKEEDLTGQRFIHTAGTDNIQVTLYKLDIPHGSLLPVDSMFSGNWMGSRGNLFFTSLHPGAYRLKINVPQGYTPYHPDSLIFEDGWSDTMFLSGDSTLHLGTTLLIPGIVPDTSSTIPPDVGEIGQDAGPQNDRFTAYPNPTTGRIRLSLPSGKSFEYTVYNHLGKVEVSGTTLNGSEIDLSGRTDGLYFISVENGNEFRATQRILILSSQ